LLGKNPINGDKFFSNTMALKLMIPEKNRISNQQNPRFFNREDIIDKTGKRSISLLIY